MVLDKTAFFPEEGGQSSDTGCIGDSKVCHVYEQDGVIHHITDTAPTIGEHWCEIDFDARFEKNAMSYRRAYTLRNNSQSFRS